MSELSSTQLAIFSWFFVISIIVLSLCICNSCTISMQNIDTHGTATDLVDETMSTDPNISPNIEVPLTGI